MWITVTPRVNGIFRLIYLISLRKIPIKRAIWGLASPPRYDRFQVVPMPRPSSSTPSHRPGFYPQPNEWTCGPFALKHAMVTLGRSVEAGAIAQTARTHWWSGTDEIRLARAARTFDCDLILERTGDAEDARKRLQKHLRDQVPVLLCVDGWAHWITVVGVE